MKKAQKPEKFWLPHGMPSDEREFAFSSRVLPKALKIKAPYKSWHYQSRGRKRRHTRAVHQERPGQKTRRSRAFPPYTLPRSLTLFLTAPHSYDAVALHRGPCRRSGVTENSHPVHKLSGPSFHPLAACRREQAMAHYKALRLVRSRPFA